jgi:tight adherence protein C
MDTTTIFIALPIFMIVYQAIDLWQESRSQNAYAGFGKNSADASLHKSIREFTQLGSKMGFNRGILRIKSFYDRLDLLLLRSGYPLGWKVEDFLFVKEISAIFGIGMIWWLGLGSPIYYPLSLILGFWLPDMYLQAKAKTRQANIQRNLPGFIDLSALALESGLDMMAAVERIVEKMKPNELRDELAMLIQETKLGTPRKEALQHLAFRVNLADIQSLTSIVIQSEELGTSLATVLRNYAEDMRTRRILRAEEIAGKAPVKILFPMMVFFFPIVFVIIFGPLAMNFAANYK